VGLGWARQRTHKSHTSDRLDVHSYVIAVENPKYVHQKPTMAHMTMGINNISALVFLIIKNDQIIRQARPIPRILIVYALYPIYCVRKNMHEIGPQRMQTKPNK